MYAIIIKLKYALLPAVAGGLIFTVFGCAKKPNHAPGEKTMTNQTAETRSVSDKSIPEFQRQLLDLAFEAASAIPLEPFIKDRSLSQEKVVDACLELDQPVRAVRYADKIANWRRGLCYANAAFYLAGNGYADEQVQKGLNLAEKIAALNHGQKWRSDRIKAKIAQTYTLLKKPETAERFSENLEDSELRGLIETTAANNPAELFEEQADILDQIIESGDFEATVGALGGYVYLFNTFYNDPEKRNLAEEKIKASWEKLPITIRMELLMTMTDYALEHNDQSKSIALVDDAQVFLDAYQWRLRDRIPYAAKLLRLRFKAGDREKAKEAADAAMELFYEQKDTEHVIYHVEMLCPLAEAYHAMGETQMTLSVYKQAAEKCSENPKSKTRAEDLSAICCSMAVMGVEPDEELRSRINRLQAGLGEPW